MILVVQGMNNVPEGTANGAVANDQDVIARYLQ